MVRIYLLMVDKNMIKVEDAKLNQCHDITNFLIKQFKENSSAFKNIFRFYKLFNLKEISLYPPGYVLKKNTEIVGFLGILSHKHTKHRDIWVLNMTSWIVSEEMKANGLKLLIRLIKNKNCLISNFSSSFRAEKILIAAGFSIIDSCELLVSTYKYFFNGVIKSSNLLFDEEAIDSIENIRERKVFQDHYSIGCKVFSLTFNEKKMAFIFLNCKDFYQFIHSTDLDMMQSKKLWQKICFILMIHYRVLKIRVDSRFLSKSIKAKKISSKKMLLFGNIKGYNKISRIYSEPLHKYGNYG